MFLYVKSYIFLSACAFYAYANFDPFFGADDSSNCTVGQFFCDAALESAKCIPLAYKCDGEFDCVDRSDEPPTCPKKQCPEGQFTCTSTGRCLPMGYRCDRELDCGQLPNGIVDTSDEANCPQLSPCPPGQHQCLDRRKCVDLAQFCDGVKQCHDGSDEHSKCARSTSPGDHPKQMCKYGGVETADTVWQCFCPRGKVPKDGDCIDENECERRRNGYLPVCQQICVNKVANTSMDAGYECSCQKGYKSFNGTYCRAINGLLEPMLKP